MAPLQHVDRPGESPAKVGPFQPCPDLTFPAVRAPAEPDQRALHRQRQRGVNAPRRTAPDQRRRLRHFLRDADVARLRETLPSPEFHVPPREVIAAEIARWDKGVFNAIMLNGIQSEFLPGGRDEFNAWAFRQFAENGILPRADHHRAAGIRHRPASWSILAKAIGKSTARHPRHACSVR